MRRSSVIFMSHLLFVTTQILLRRRCDKHTGACICSFDQFAPLLRLSCFLALFSVYNSISSKSSLLNTRLRANPMNLNRRHFNFSLVLSLGSLSFRRLTFQPQLRINGPRLMEHLHALAEFGKNPQGGVSRVAYIDAEKQRGAYVVGIRRMTK